MSTLLSIFSISFTLFGVIIFIKGDITNGLLAMILGELIDVPKRKLA